MDKKLTDNEIVKALECCIKPTSDCENCPLYIMGDGDCVDKSKQGALDLINRLEARIGIYETCNARKDEAIKHLESEVKRLRAENTSQSIMIKMLNGSIEDYKEAYINQKAEVERLTVLADLGNMRANDYRAMRDKCKTAKAEAYKEFADRLKENSIATFSWNGIVLVDEIDNLLKEMVGDNNVD